MPILNTSDGVSIHYREEGSGSPLVMIPGWACTTRYFDRQFEALSSQFRVISFDPRGQGESEKTLRGRRMGRVAHDVHDLLVKLNLQGVTLLGWSLGCSTLLSYVDLFGADRLSKLVCVAGGPRLINREGWSHGFVDPAGAEAWRNAVANDFATLADQIVPKFFHLRPDDAEYARLRAETLKTEPAAGAAAMTWDCLNQNYADVLPQITLPTCVVLGGMDDVVPVTNASVFAAVPRVRVEIFERSGHSPFIEEADRFNDLIREFMIDSRQEKRAEAQ